MKIEINLKVVSERLFLFQSKFFYLKGGVNFKVWLSYIVLHDWSHFSSLKPLLPIHHSKLDRQELLYPCKRKKWLFCCGGGLGRVLQTYIFPKRQVLNLTATITWNWRKSHFATLNYKQKKHRMLNFYVLTAASGFIQLKR